MLKNSNIKIAVQTLGFRAVLFGFVLLCLFTLGKDSAFAVGCCANAHGCGGACCEGTNCDPPATTCTICCSSSDGPDCSTGACTFTGGCGGDGGCTEDNVKPATPTYVNISSDGGATFQPASTDIDDPTIVTGVDIVLQFGERSPVPPGDGRQFKIRLDTGFPSWKSNSCDDMFPDDVCQNIGVNPNTYSFTSSDETSYSFWVHNSRNNKCDTGWQNSGYITVYFDVKLNKPPAIVSVTPIGLNCDSGWSGRYLEFGGENVDNPLNIEVVISDPDIGHFGILPSEEISRVWLALAPDEEDDLGEANCGVWENDLENYFGAMYIVAEGTWSVADPTQGDPCPWGSSNPNFDLELVDMVSVGDNLSTTWRVRFQDNFPEGRYKFFAMADDVYGASTCPTGGYCWQEFGDWGIDHTLPSLDSFASSVGSNRINIHWEAGDALSGIRNISNAITYPPSGAMPNYLTLEGIWFIGTYPFETFSESGDDLLTVVVNDVPETGIDLSGISKTVMDDACNIRELHDAAINWGGHWLRTEGGDVFSSAGTINIVPADTTEYDSCDYSPHCDKMFSRYMYLKDLGFYDSLGSVADNVCTYGDSWNMETEKIGSLVETEVDDLLDYVATLGSVVTVGGREYHITEQAAVGNLIINDKLRIYYTPGNMTITPDILVGDILSGVIFLAGGDITILAGDDHSVGSVGEDVIEGLLIAGGSVRTKLDFGTSTDYADSVLIKGGVISLKQISVERNLGFKDNLTSSSERFIYDARYIDLFRPLLGELGPVQFVESGMY